MATEKPWGQGFVSSAVLIELEKNAGKSHKFCEGGIAELLPKIMERTEQKYNSIDGNSYLSERASVAPYLRKCGNLPLREILVIT